MSVLTNKDKASRTRTKALQIHNKRDNRFSSYQFLHVIERECFNGLVGAIGDELGWPIAQMR